MSISISIRCFIVFCDAHEQMIEELYNDIVTACITAGKLAIPTKNKKKRTGIAG